MLRRSEACVPDAATAAALSEPGRASWLPPSGTLTLCLLTLATALAQSAWDGGRLSQAVGVVPENLTSLSSLTRTGAGQMVPVWLTVLTYVFPHGGWWHVVPNVTALWVFGCIAERVTGTLRFVLTYFIAGAVGAFCLALVPPHGPGATAGASLAISGSVGAYAAWRWSSRAHSGRQRLLLFLLEAASVAGVVAWLVFRTVPATPDLSCSVLYHFMPFLALWLGAQVFGGDLDR